ncbi:hypothetical protein KJ953_02860 [Patescibacteria group bacterium]|nr:hypothetical protein [Patescibacteria group bacterium]MBU1256081.1 hypothetical protein [Patescibacteria group bacterium]MBU1457617.1 hypothetical protein [Patescibacteria group bacterium]
MSLTKIDLKKIKDLIHEAISEFYTTLIQTNFVTKTDLKKELKNLATKQDLKEELSNYATKQDLKEELSNYATRDDILSFKDEILTEIRKMREESLMIHYRVYDQHQPQLEDHEKRIGSLESFSIVA